jgi:hypothetical protein
MMTILAQLIASNTDNMGYITYVFKCLEDRVAQESEYIMCTRYPNWNHKKVNLGDIGFLEFNIVIAGKDTWYNGESQIPYKYNAVQFLRFIEKPKEINHEYIM